MLDDHQDYQRFRVKLLFGLFEADATGTVAIGATLVLFVLMGAGRWWALWKCWWISAGHPPLSLSPTSILVLFSLKRGGPGGSRSCCAAPRHRR